LVLENNGTKKLITIDYNNPTFILKQIFAWIILSQRW
jgi:hypothetical protein